MTTVQVTGISLAFGDRDVLKNINFNLSTQSRVALSGGNGSGKSTLMKILGGQNSPDKGQVVFPRGIRSYYLPQSGIVYKERTLLEEAETAYERAEALLRELDSVGKELEENPHGKTDSLLDKYNKIHEEILESGYYSRSEEITRVLTGLGFKKEDLAKEAGSFSGGWQMRIALAKALLQKPHQLLLDEPTNYLDIEARDWLAKFLNNFEGGVFIVSHDRFFLDNLVSEVAELFNGSLKIYKGNYTQYESRREQELKELVEAYHKQQEEIAKHEDFIRRFKAKASKASAAQSRMNQLERMELIELPSNMKSMKISFPPPPHSGKNMVMIEGLHKSYGEHHVIKDLNLHLERGEKLVVAGKNGAGKSTLLRILSGTDTTYRGKFRLGTDVKVGYFSQDHDEKLDPEKSVLEELESDSPMELIPKLRSLLGSFLFHGDDVFKSVDVLSGGEKNRLSLLKMLLKPFNLLILDEPTNHLDINAKDVLLTALKEYDGTLIFVSHDRYFIDNLATKVLELENGQHRLYIGDYEYYRWKKEQLSDGNEREATAAPTPQEEARSVSRLSRDEDKKLKNLIRKLEREEEELLQKIEEAGEKLAELQELMGLPENYSDAEKARELVQKIGEAEKGEEELTARWEEVTLELSEAVATRENS